MARCWAGRRTAGADGAAGRPRPGRHGESAQGIAGPQGPQGVAGATGSAGPKGDKGDTGLTGATGVAGPTGPTLPGGAVNAVYTKKSATDGDVEWRGAGERPDGSTILGAGASSSGVAVIVGQNASANYGSEVVIGNNAHGYGGVNVAIGDSAIAGGSYTTAIGRQAQTGGVNSVALGMGTAAGYDGSVAIGINSSYQPASTTAANQIMLGSTHTVRVPGTLDARTFTPEMVTALSTALPAPAAGTFPLITRAALDTLANAGGLATGQPYFITDGNTLAVGTDASHYVNIVSGAIGPALNYDSLKTEVDVPVVSLSSDGAISLGTRFHRAGSTAIKVRGLRWYRSNVPQSTPPMVYLSVAGANTVLASKAATAATPGAAVWETVLFDTPYTINDNADYIVWVYLPGGGYYGTGATFPGPVTSRLGLYVAPAQAGRFQQPPTSSGADEPVSSFSNTFYWVDPLVST